MFAKIKKILAVVLAVACVCSVIVTTARGGRSSTTIKLSFWGTNLPYENALKEAANLYNASQSEWKVEISREDAGNYRLWMSSQLAGGNAPEILATTSVYADADAANGYLCDLAGALDEPNPYNSLDEPWRGDFAGTYLAQLEDKNVSGRFNCIPTSTVSVRIVVNEEMFRARGLEMPDETWTFSDFRRVSEVFEAEGITAMEVANAKYINYMVSWMLDIFAAQVEYDKISDWDSNGNGMIETEEIVRLFQDGDTKLDFTDDEEFQSVLRFLRVWSRYWGRGFNARSDTSENFLRQKVPMYLCGSWGVSGIELTLGNENPDADKTNPYRMFDYCALPFPRLERENYVDADTSFAFPTLKEKLPLQELGEPSDCFCIPRSTEENGKLEGALDFLRYLTSFDTAALMADRAYLIPVVKGVEVNEKMRDFLPPENSESIRMRFNLLNLADGTAEEYHFKQMQMYLDDGNSAISLATLCKNIQNKYLSVTAQLAEDNEWSW